MSTLTLLQEKLRAGEITPDMEQVAKNEGVTPELIRQELAAGAHCHLQKPVTRDHCKPLGIGRHLTTKVNANIGTSEAHADVAVELEKLRVSVEAGADTVMDLSTGGSLKGNSANHLTGIDDSSGNRAYLPDRHRNRPSKKKGGS